MCKKAIAAISLLVMAILTASCGVLAEEPEVEDVEELEAEKNVTFMFVQTAHSGTLVPVEGAENLYALTLVGVALQTIAFSDRPERIVVQVPMQQFLDGLCFSAENPPNAAIEILDADEEMDVAVVELFDPVYDNESQTLQYNVSILEEPDHSYAVFNEQHDAALPETFGPVALFIDDCPDGKVSCQEGKFWGICGYINTGCCWSWHTFSCNACHSANYYTDKCVTKYGNKCGDWCDQCTMANV